jgi:hypothetical protein
VTTRAATTGAVVSGQQCRRCDQPVTVIVAPGISPYLGKAVHTATGLETGPDGHLAAPIDASPARRALVMTR